MSLESPTAVLSDDQISTFVSVLDALIPPSEDGALPGAGELGLAETICQGAEGFLPVLASALDALEERVATRETVDFASLPDAKKQSVLEELVVDHPAFLPGLLFQTFSNYYQHPRVLGALGLEAGPPHPRGHDLEVGDLDLLDPVRSRGSIYRDC